MMTFIIILAVLAGVYVGCSVFERKALKKPVIVHGATPEQLAEADELGALSKAAQRIVAQYRVLPEELQMEDVLPMVKALDLKYGVSSVDSHFTVPKYSDETLKKYREQYYSSRLLDYDNYVPRQQYLFSWDSPKAECKHLDGCDFPEYRSLYEAILEADRAKKEQDRALEIAGVQHDLDAVQALIGRFREETTIMKSVTKELS